MNLPPVAVAQGGLSESAGLLKPQDNSAGILPVGTGSVSPTLDAGKHNNKMFVPSNSISPLLITDHNQPAMYDIRYTEVKRDHDEEDVSQDVTRRRQENETVMKLIALADAEGQES